MSFAARYGPMLASLGYVQFPTLLLEHQGRLGLSGSEVVYILHVLRHLRDDGQWPWLSVRDVADMMGCSERQAQRHKASLVAKHYLRCRPRSEEGRGQLADEHDLTVLLAELERLGLQAHLDAVLPKCRYLPLLGTRELSTGGDRSVARGDDGNVTGGRTDPSPAPVTSASPVQDPGNKTPGEERIMGMTTPTGGWNPAYLAEMERRRRAG